MAEAQIRAGQVVLKTTPDSYTVEDLQGLLADIAKNPVTVANGSITVDDSDAEAVKVLLAEIGIDVLDSTVAAADEPPAAPDAAPAPVAAPAAPIEPAAPDAPVATAAAAPVVAAVPAAPAVAASAPAAAPVAAAPAPAAPAVAAAAAAPAPSVTAEEVYDEAEKAAMDDGLCASFVTSTKGNKSWLLSAGSNPIAAINLEDQDDAAEIEAFFVTPEFSASVFASMQKNGFKKTLKSLNAQMLTAKTIRAEEAIDLEEVGEKVLARFRQCQSMAISAAQKNFAANALKAAADEVLSDLGIPDVDTVVEAIFAKFPAFMAELDEQADEYMKLDDSGLTATQNMLGKAGLQARAAVPARSVHANAHARALTAANTPVQVPAATPSPTALTATENRRSIAVMGSMGHLALNLEPQQ